MQGCSPNYLTINIEIIIMAKIKSNLHTLTDSADRILLLQGPVGHFFRDFARWLEQRGKQVSN